MGRRSKDSSVLGFARSRSAWIAFLIFLSLSGLILTLTWKKETAQTAALLMVCGGGTLTFVFLYWVSLRNRLHVQLEQMRLAAMVDNSGDAIIGLSLHGLVESWNQAAEFMFGYTASEAIGCHVDELILPPGMDRPDFRAALASDNHLGAEEARRRTKRGEMIDVSVVTSPIRNPSGRVIGAAKIIRDVTMQKAVQARLLELNETLELQVKERTRRLEEASLLQRTILAHAGYAVIATAPDGMVTLFNPAAERMLGYRSEDVVNKVTPEVFHDPNEIAARSIALSRDLACKMAPGFEVLVARARRGMVDETRWTYVRRDGTRFPVQLSVSALKNDEDEILGFLGIAIDQSEMRAREEALHRARADAESSNRAKSQFLANMSHEIRTPMNAILGTLDLLRRTELDPRQTQHANMAESATRTLLRIINDILDLSKIEAGKLRLAPQPFELDALLSSTARILAPSIASRPVRILFDVDPHAPRWLVGDSLRLQQVMLNLTGNAIKFTARGNVTVILRSAPTPEGRVALSFSIADQGIGMSRQQLARVFDSFEQAEASTTRRFGGTGLGLAISRGLVSVMGGCLEADSEPGQGSTFRFTIHMDVASADQIRESKPRDWRRGPQSLRLLHVDKNVAARHVYAQLAGSLGWRIEEVGSATEAMRIIRNASAIGNPFEAILLDGGLGPDNTAALANHLRIQCGASPAMILVATTLHGQQTLVDFNCPSIDGFLIEPVTASILRDTVSEVRARRSGSQRRTRSTPKRLIGMRILLVEDNDLNQRVATALLTGEGAELVVANDGVEGVECLRRSPEGFDVVLMDIQMPKLDGYAATRRIRQEMGLRTVPILAMTANAMRSDIDACRAAGMNDHVSKPFHVDDLVARLLRHTGRTTPSHSGREPEPQDAGQETPSAELLDLSPLQGVQ